MAASWLPFTTRFNKANKMIPGELKLQNEDIELNVGRATIVLDVKNSGDRPVQIGSHYHFYEVNAALVFDREKSRGYRLNTAAGTAVRFEPGQNRKVELVAFSGRKHVYGFNAQIMGALENK